MNLVSYVLKRGALALSVWLFWVPVATSAPASRQAFTVEHSIEMTVLNDVDRNLLNGETVPLSPDGRHFFVVTRKGNLATGVNDYTMWLYECEAVRRSIPKADLPRGLPIVKFSASSNRAGIARARWMEDSRTIAFLAENPGQTPQLYTFDIQTKVLTRKTDHPSAIVDFDLNLASSEFIYFAEYPADNSERIAHGYEVDNTFVLDVMKGGSALIKRGAFYIGGTADSPAREVNIEPYQFNGSRGIWLAPQGRWAIVTRLVTAAPKSWWTDYRPVNHPPFNQASSAQLESFSTPNPAVFLQYMLVDVRTGEAKPLLDAPTGLLFGGMALDAQWLPDGVHVIVANTFLPLRGVDGEELERRKASPSVVELNLETGKILRIRDLLVATPEDSRPMRPFVGTDLQANGDLSLTLQSGGRERSVLLRKIRGAWQEIGVPKDQKRSGPRLTVNVVQSLNEAPELRATDVISGRSKVVTDLNPQFRGLEMGQAEAFHWTDANGRPWMGGLLKPIGYEPGKRYPLVIQTHGFDPTKFLIDGPFGSPSGYAARALINRGIMVLQAQDAPPPYGVPEEPVNQVKGFESAVATLARAGLIDPERVGLHGFSRTGLAVQHALVFSTMKIAAASVADANSVGMLNYLLSFGGGYPAMMDTEWIVGAPLWGDENAQRWQERDPIFHLDRVRAPLLIHAYMAPGWFDAYAILRRHRRPVEYWAYPDSAHNPVKPWHRRTTQGLTVDWYDFWLNGHEDPDPAKADQYERWRELRRLRDDTVSGG